MNLRDAARFRVPCMSLQATVEKIHDHSVRDHSEGGEIEKLHLH
jgi:hypothetical protein